MLFFYFKESLFLSVLPPLAAFKVGAETAAGNEPSSWRFRS